MKNLTVKSILHASLNISMYIFRNYFIQCLYYDNIMHLYTFRPVTRLFNNEISFFVVWMLNNNLKRWLILTCRYYQITIQQLNEHIIIIIILVLYYIHMRYVYCICSLYTNKSVRYNVHNIYIRWNEKTNNNYVKYSRWPVGPVVWKTQLIELDNYRISRLAWLKTAN